MRVHAGVQVIAVALCAAMVRAADLSWSEGFMNDPVPAGRFSVPPGHDPSRFTYNGGASSLTVHYDTLRPTAWYGRPLDATNHRKLTDCDDFQFEVTFRISSAGFYADPGHYAQIGWALVNSTTTGTDRAGGSGPYAFDCMGFDYFPNVSPSFGGPTVGATVIHSNQGQGFFGAIDFPFGAESRLDAPLGDQIPALDTVYAAKITYSGVARTAVLRIRQGTQALSINSDGDGGPGGPDADPATIQTTLFYPEPFTVDRFALTTWEDTSNGVSSSVVADVDILSITFSAPAFIKGDMNRDGRVDGRDITIFVQTLLASQPDPCLVTRADFNNDAAATSADIAGFQGALLAP